MIPYLWPTYLRKRYPSSPPESQDRMKSSLFGALSSVSAAQLVTGSSDSSCFVQGQGAAFPLREE